MPKTKDGYLIDDKPIKEPMTLEEAKEYIRRAFNRPKKKKAPKKSAENDSNA